MKSLNAGNTWVEVVLVWWELSDILDTTLAVELIFSVGWVDFGEGRCGGRGLYLTTSPSSDITSNCSMERGARGEDMEDQSDNLEIRLESAICNKFNIKQFCCI